MLFNSHVFIILFLPTSVLVFYVLGSHGFRQMAMIWLGLVSLFFYGWWNPIYVPLLIGSIAANYFFGSLLSRDPVGRYAGFVLAVGVAFNLGLLGYFKYANFFVENVNAIFNANWTLSHIVLPLAISFFTFQQIAYLIDVKRREVVEYDLLRYFIFVSFFPQLIAGPIVHHKEMMPQFGQSKFGQFSAKNLSVGTTIFIIGLFKKVVIADNVAPFSTGVFDAAYNGGVIPFFAAWQGSLAYTAQIYFDFSGYSDMAIGLGRMFGVRLPINFASPYKATSIIDFWRSWHMTLSRFLRDYLYFPLGGNQHGQGRRYLNLMIVMLLGGLWHGAGWTFVIWGGLHGCYLIVNSVWRASMRLLGKSEQRSGWLGIWTCRGVTLLAVMVAWVFFRAESLDAAIVILGGMFGVNGVELAPATLVQGTVNLASLNGLLLSASLVLAATLLPNTQQIMRRYRPALGPIEVPDSMTGWLIWRPTTVAALITMGAGTWALLNLWSPSEFLYFQF